MPPPCMHAIYHTNLDIRSSAYLESRGPIPSISDELDRPLQHCCRMPLPKSNPTAAYSGSRRRPKTPRCPCATIDFPARAASGLCRGSRATSGESVQRRCRETLLERRIERTMTFRTQDVQRGSVSVRSKVPRSINNQDGPGMPSSNPMPGPSASLHAASQCRSGLMYSEK